MTYGPLALSSRLAMNPAALGMLYGLGAVLIWGGYLALARLGITNGLTGMDFALMRFGVAGLIMLPWLARHAPASLGGVGWARGAALALFAGPAFLLLGVGGYAFAPLAHGAVFQPATMVVVTTALAWPLLGDRLSRERLMGVGIIIAGLAVIAGPGLRSGSILTPVGDLMFAGAGALWAGFALLTRRWRVRPMPATAAVSVLSMLAIVPAFVATQDFSRLAALPLPALATQMVVQGLLSGVVAIALFARSVELLGAAKAAIFPALVPAAAILIGIPVTGEWPTVWQTIGVTVVSAGLMVAMTAPSDPTPKP